MNQHYFSFVFFTYFYRSIFQKILIFVFTKIHLDWFYQRYIFQVFRFFIIYMISKGIFIWKYPAKILFSTILIDIYIYCDFFYGLCRVSYPTIHVLLLSLSSSSNLRFGTPNFTFTRFSPSWRVISPGFYMQSFIVHSSHIPVPT